MPRVSLSERARSLLPSGFLRVRLTKEENDVYFTSLFFLSITNMGGPRLPMPHLQDMSPIINPSQLPLLLLLLCE